MTTRDTGLSGSHNCSDTSSQQSLLEEQQSNPSRTMSATTVYPNPYYPPVSAFNHNPSNPAHHLYRRPSQPGLPIYSSQCTPVPTASGFGVSDQYPGSESTPARNNTGPPLPPSSVHQVASGMSQPPILRTNTNTPVNQNLSQPHLRISSFSNPPTPIDSAIHLDIVDHPVAELVNMLALKLQNLITSNDRLKRSSTPSKGSGFPSSTTTASSSSNKSDSRLLSFHARNIPSITIGAYLNRILKYCPTDPEVFISVLVYFDRILRIANHQARPIFGSYFTSYNLIPTLPLVRSAQAGRPPDDDTFAIDSFNVHRLVITTIAVATKFFSDQFYTNSRYARVGGLPLTELNHLEIQFLILQDFNLMIPPAEIQFYADHLLRFWIMEQRQTDKSFMGIIPPQPPTNLEYTSPITPMVQGGTFFPPPSTTCTPSTTSSTSTATTVAYSHLQPQYASQPMDGVESTNSPPH